MSEECIFCHRDPYHYVDIGVGFQAAAVNCCDLGVALYQHGDEDLARVADRIEELEKKNASLEAAIKRQAGAARTLRECTLAEVRHLSDMDRSEYFAVATVDSERDANAILTARIEELEAKLVKALKALKEIKRYSPCGDSRRKAIDTLAELTGEQP